MGDQNIVQNSVREVLELILPGPNIIHENIVEFIKFHGSLIQIQNPNPQVIFGNVQFLIQISFAFEKP